MTTREATAAGDSYPRDPDLLIRKVSALLGSRPGAGDSKTNAAAIMVPHGSFAQSGAVAAAVYAQIEVPRVCVVLSTNHAGMGGDAVIMNRGSWTIPTAEIPIHEELADCMMSECPLLQVEVAPHRVEDGIEVQLPFLHHLNPELQFVPILFKYYPTEPREDWFEANDSKIKNIAHALAAAIRKLDEPVLIVVSGDLNHYENLEITQTKDAKAIEAILSQDPETVISEVIEKSLKTCAAIPLAVALLALGELGMGPAQLIKYGTSAEADGDEHMVVGYAGLLIG